MGGSWLLDSVGYQCACDLLAVIFGRYYVRLRDMQFYIIDHHSLAMLVSLYRSSVCIPPGCIISISHIILKSIHSTPFPLYIPPPHPPL